jgi:glycosyltransferase involved in cell wall biosynthesis
MKIILATYNYYPYQWGGSEVYVHGLAKYLQSIGYQVLVIAAIPHTAHQALNKQAKTFAYQDQFLQATAYEYEGVNVLGASLLHETTTEIYGRYNANHVSSWLNLQKKYDFFQESINILHYNGYTGLISTALAKALQTYQQEKKQAPTKVIASYHTPISCPNGKLLYFGKQACAIRPNAKVCTACFVYDRKNISKTAAKLIGNLLPTLDFEKLPTTLRVKSLVNLSLQSFQLLDNEVHQWIAMSDYIQEVLLNTGVQPHKIARIRHGVHQSFLNHNANNATTNNTTRGTQLPTTFVYAGRFEQIKGFHTLLKVWLGLPQNPEKRILQLVGSPQTAMPDLDELLQAAQKRNDVLFLGKKDAKEIKEILLATACMIIPSEWVEIGPLVLHEAIACGTNVLASNIGGTAELAKFYGQGCQTFEMGNEKDLEAKILAFDYQKINHQVQSQTAHYQAVTKNYK